MIQLRDGGRRIILGHAHDVRETASLLAADPLSVFRIVNALDPPSCEVDFDQLVAAAVERVRRRFSSRGRNLGNKYARVAYAWLKHRKWQALHDTERTTPFIQPRNTLNTRKSFCRVEVEKCRNM